MNTTGAGIAASLEAEPVQKVVKCIVVGDDGVGKTSLLISFCTNMFMTDYVPTVMDNYMTTVSHDGKSFNVGLWDTLGSQDHDHLRPLVYKEADVFLICFSIASPQSFERIRSHWSVETRQYCPMAKRILVGTKGDLRDDPSANAQLLRQGLKMVDKDDAVAFAKDIEACEYLECSALTQVGVSTVFERAAAVGSMSLEDDVFTGIYAKK
jgi:small GTP-binding protein